MSAIAPIEDRIIKAIVERALATGRSISVGDGEDFSLEQSTDAGAIMAEVGATDETVFVVYTGVSRLGFIHFVHGNDEDVLSDCTANMAIDDITNGAVYPEVSQ